MISKIQATFCGNQESHFVPECTKDTVTMHSCIAVLVAYWTYSKVITSISREHIENSTGILEFPPPILYDMTNPLVRVPPKKKRVRLLSNSLLSRFQRKEGDSNPRNPLEVHTLSRRARSATPASFRMRGQI